MRKCHMTWVASARRWTKWYRGKNYAVSCRQLGCPETKEGSWRQANEWWSTKKSEVDAQEPQKLPHPHQAAINRLAEKIDWAAQHAPEEIPALQKLIEEAEQTDARIDAPEADCPTIARNLALFERWAGIELPDDIEYEILTHFFGDRRLWKDRLRRQPVQQIDHDNTLGYWAGKFLDLVRSKKPGTYQNIKYQIDAFINCNTVTTPKMPISKINESLWEDYFVTIANSSKIGPDMKKTRLIHARRFIRYLWQRHLIELPRNLNSDEFRVTIPLRTIKLPPLDTVTDCLKMLAEEDDFLRLVLLLMLNCGMYQGDISDLKQEEVDWEKGYITWAAPRFLVHPKWESSTLWIVKVTVALALCHAAPGRIRC